MVEASISTARTREAREKMADSDIGTPHQSSSQRARHLSIAELVLKQGSVSIEEIVEHTGVSMMTVYRDVNALESAGLLQRHRGRVSAVASGLHEASAAFRVEQEPQSKAEIARAIARKIPVGSSVVLDDSTSALYLVRELVKSPPMTVVTNSLLIARETSRTPEIELFLTGGSYQGWADAVLGPTTLATLSGLDADFCVLSASGLSNGKCYHPYQDVAAVKQAMLNIARTRILVLDHSKLHRTALHLFASLDEFEYVIVDEAFPEGARQQLVDWGANVEVAASEA